MIPLNVMQRDTLIRYLLDELNTYEEDHSDALAPVDRRASESYAGEAAEMGPVSAAECRNLFQMQSFFIQKTVKNEVFAALTTPSLVQVVYIILSSFHLTRTTDLCLMEYFRSK